PRCHSRVYAQKRFDAQAGIHPSLPRSLLAASDGSKAPIARMTDIVVMPDGLYRASILEFLQIIPRRLLAQG
ncbi:MAG: hypothetical protein ACQ9IQ_14845, partial [Nitrospirales bacterium]